MKAIEVSVESVIIKKAVEIYKCKLMRQLRSTVSVMMSATLGLNNNVKKKVIKYKWTLVLSLN